MTTLNTMSSDEVLKKIGRSLETMRLEEQIPDAEVVSRGGIKASTWANLKAGKNVTVGNLVKALIGLNRLSMLESLINYSPAFSPMSLVEARESRLKKRIRRKSGDESGEFRWGDEE